MTTEQHKESRNRYNDGSGNNTGTTLLSRVRSWSGNSSALFRLCIESIIDYIPVDSGPLLFVVIANLCRNLLQIISCTQKLLSGEGSNPLSTGRG